MFDFVICCAIFVKFFGVFHIPFHFFWRIGIHLQVSARSWPQKTTFSQNYFLPHLNNSLYVSPILTNLSFHRLHRIQNRTNQLVHAVIKSLLLPVTLWISSRNLFKNKKQYWTFKASISAIFDGSLNESILDWMLYRLGDFPTNIFMKNYILIHFL